MKSVRSLPARIVIVAMLLLAQALMVPFAAAAEPPAVPSKIAVPAGSALLFSRHARGVQVYACVNSAWALHAPRAVLFNPKSNRADGFHYGGIDRDRAAGPWWESIRDGSAVRGARVDGVPSPDPNSIPWLLLAVVEHSGAGEFSPVTHIQRLNTSGGASPSGACKPGMMRSVPYTADYFFYAAP